MSSRQMIINKMREDLSSIALGLLLCGIYIGLMSTILGVVCPFRILLGLPCPGCGLSRAALPDDQYDKNREVMTMGDWFLTLIVLAIPCVNIVMYFVWAFGNGNESRKNFCKVSLILGVISIVLALIYYVTMGTALRGFY